MTHSGQATNPTARRFRKKWNAPPLGKPWVWLTDEMMDSAAWRAMPQASRRILDRVMIEHMRHAGTANGALPVTYDDFVAYGIRRSSVAVAIAVAIKLGWLDLVVRGVSGHGIARRPHQFGLTWLPRADYTPASNRWKTISEDAARDVLQLFAQSQKRKHLVTLAGLGDDRTENEPLKVLNFQKRRGRHA